MKAVIHLDVPEWQIGQEVTVYFPDTMQKRAVCELLKEQEAKKPKHDPIWEFVCPRDGCKHRLRFLQSYCDLCGQALNWKET